MTGRLFGIFGALILAGWLYWLTARVQVLLTHVETTLDRADRTLAAAVAMVASATPVAAASSTSATAQEEVPAAAPSVVAVPPPAPVPPVVLAPAGGPPTVPTGMALEAEKRALVERAFSVHGAPRRFTFKTSDTKDT